MYCRNCGSRLAEGAATCSNCGSAVRPEDGTQPFAMQPVGEPSFASDANAFAGPFNGGRVDWTLQDVLFALLWFLALLILLPIPIVIPFAVISGDIESTASYHGNLLGSGLAQIGFVVTAVWFSFRKYGGSWQRLGFRTPTWSTVGWGLAAVVAAFALAAGYGGLIELFDVEQLKSQCDDQIPEDILNNTGLMVMTGVIVIAFAPFCEETLFRGLVFTGMTKAWGVGAAIVVSGIVFASAHISLAWHKTFVPIFIIAAVFAAAYYKSGNIWSTIGAHAIFNTLSFVQLTTCDPDDAQNVSWARNILAGALGR
jgi:membrane protease YdiL (CAAX protease family)